MNRLIALRDFPALDRLIFQQRVVSIGEHRPESEQLKQINSNKIIIIRVLRVSANVTIVRHDFVTTLVFQSAIIRREIYSKIRINSYRRTSDDIVRETNRFILKIV